MRFVGRLKSPLQRTLRLFVVVKLLSLCVFFLYSTYCFVLVLRLCVLLSWMYSVAALIRVTMINEQCTHHWDSCDLGDYNYRFGIFRSSSWRLRLEIWASLGLPLGKYNQRFRHHDQHRHFVDTAKMFCGQGAGDPLLAARQFTGFCKEISRNSSDFIKLLVMCTVCVLPYLMYCQ